MKHTACGRPFSSSGRYHTKGSPVYHFLPVRFHRPGSFPPTRPNTARRNEKKKQSTNPSEFLQVVAGRSLYRPVAADRFPLPVAADRFPLPVGFSASSHLPVASPVAASTASTVSTASTAPAPIILWDPPWGNPFGGLRQEHLGGFPVTQDF